MSGNIAVTLQTIIRFTFSKNINPCDLSSVDMNQRNGLIVALNCTLYHISVLHLSFNFDMLGTWISSLKCRIIIKSNSIIIVTIYHLQA